MRRPGVDERLMPVRAGAPSTYFMATMTARLSLSLECGETHWARPAFDALRRWVRKSLIGSVMDGCFGCGPVGSYPTSGGKVVYQEDFVTPGILPASAS